MKPYKKKKGKTMFCAIPNVTINLHVQFNKLLLKFVPNNNRLYHK